MNHVNSYINYFRQLAIANQALLHDPAGEYGDAAPASMHFTKISVDEVVQGLHSKIGSPCLTLELYETDLQAEIPYDIRELPVGAFMVVVKPASDLMADMQICYEKAEEIIINLLKQIWQDHYGVGVERCKTPFKEFYFDKDQLTPVGPVFDTWYGYRFTFNFRFHYNMDITKAPDPGTFIFTDNVLIDLDTLPLENSDLTNLLLS